MDWSSESLYSKAKLYARRAHDEAVESAMFGFWMSLSLERKRLVNPSIEG